jgi:hypothetical protein
MTENGTVTKTPRRDRFASGAAVKLALSDGDWILVRKELTYGQQRRLATAGLEGLPPSLAVDETQKLRVDWAEMDFERLAVWIMEWSLVDGDGDPVPISREAIERLHPDTATEIQTVLRTYLEAEEAKKKSAPGYAEQLRSDLVVCHRFGWTWAELMATPESVVRAAVDLLNEEAEAARIAAIPTDGPGR